MKLRRRTILPILLGLPLVAVFVAWLGIFNVAASTGHWPITNWFLHFAMRSSVRTYALGIVVPDLDSTGLLQPAAVHFEEGCAFCHGAPGVRASPSALAMLPPPPDLPGKVGEWTDAQLFRIVRHGVRYTGMPAWPALERTDEVWGMVALLRRLPALEAESYRRLVEAPPALESQSALDAALAGCARCHGRDGLGRDLAVPIIAGQSSAYLFATLKAYALGQRPSGMMKLAVSGASDDLLNELAHYYAERSRPESMTANDPTSETRGRQIAESGLPQKGVPACLSCHGGSRRNPFYPTLSGQKRIYVETQLRLFASGTRGGTEYSHLMAKVAGKLDDRDIADLAAYFASSHSSLKPTP